MKYKIESEVNDICKVELKEEENSYKIVFYVRNYNNKKSCLLSMALDVHAVIDSAHIFYFYIQPIGEHMGSTIMASLICALRQMKTIKYVTLQSKNATSRKFWSSLGFRYIEKDSHYISDLFYEL